MTEVGIADADIRKLAGQYPSKPLRTLRQRCTGDKFRGKSAIVTGGSSVIGQGIVHYLVKSGAKVLIGDVQPPIEPVDGPIYLKTDAGSWEELLALFKNGEELFGRIDIVVPMAASEIVGTTSTTRMPTAIPSSLSSHV
jgi:NAD(P)-dependent dehydrogenase (short-subunit alcohol dehydrogenase family)